MRIISGKYKGRQLVGFKSKHIRPTTDRVKESIFNKLIHDLDGAKVLDLFAGTGNLTIEALSRGAESVESVELRTSSLKIIKENLAHLKIDEGVRLHCKDAFKFVRSYDGEAFDLIFVDPPFTEKFADSILEEISKSKVFASHTRIIIEATIHEVVQSEYGPLEKTDERHFGDKIVFFFGAKDITE